MALMHLWRRPTGPPTADLHFYLGVRADQNQWPPQSTDQLKRLSRSYYPTVTTKYRNTERLSPRQEATQNPVQSAEPSV
jgi:hypothetical protein